MLGQQYPWLFTIFLLVTTFFHPSFADVGTAAHYSPPYLPTACSGNDDSHYLKNNLFAAAGDRIWDNGASCGRQFLVRCISAATPGTCNPSQTIQNSIVDRVETSVSRPSTNGATIILSTAAFGAITNPSADSVDIEFLTINNCFILLCVKV
ncbi:1-deoxy-D-xylulose 5-phosphate synthase 3 isoform 1 [Hibiscus syriacus]|uniref:1-deoxy-D-xylulose 5-phosphate synthase 3 isoform 1 n=1 Tax=Hibiscus syriacus TaxID=106335 RepID=A0A6A2YTL7_HIBSY|nr:EG45-like domain containing protein [Hibiscus syriacus]KAE8682726.1 1-deoxy-D-xylulose 5-phosphate synthase 3 isoform 1 [Hibiscus syriacus]